MHDNNSEKFTIELEIADLIMIRRALLVAIGDWRLRARNFAKNRMMGFAKDLQNSTVEAQELYDRLTLLRIGEKGE